MMNGVVIGGGVHGLSSALVLARGGMQVSLLEKEAEVMTKTSMGTQYRGHLGYHYPRSPETVAECFEGLEFFKKKYPEALFYPAENYYLIAKEGSKTSYAGYKEFCDAVGLPYQEAGNHECFWHKESIEGGFKVPEPVYNPHILKQLLKKEASDLGIRIHTQAQVIGFEEKKNSYWLITSGRKHGTDKHKADIIVNATYAYTNNLLKIMGLKQDMTEYFLQHTEVVIARSKKYVPALTVMDGPFVSLLPVMGKEENGLYVVYDVINSVLDQAAGYFFDDAGHRTTNWNKMVGRGEKYYPFFGELEYVKSLYGSRPIPIKAVGDSRHTRIMAHQALPGIYSIFEGKFISAPLMAQKLAEKMREEGVI